MTHFPPNIICFDGLMYEINIKLSLTLSFFPFFNFYIYKGNWATDDSKNSPCVSGRKEAVRMWVMKKVLYMLYLLGRIPDLAQLEAL